MSQHILYCNDDANVLVLDLPASIARAQESNLRLCSTPALEKPHITPEPKDCKRELLLAAIPASEREYHQEIQSVVRAALAILHKQWHEPNWFHSRIPVDESRLSVGSRCSSHHEEPTAALPPLVLSSSLNCVCCSSAFINTVVHNPYLHPADFAVSTQGRFIIPAQSTFLSATIEEGLEVFEIAVNYLLPGRLFDLVLLDPPWSNRSVRNSQAYQSAECQQSDPFEKAFRAVSTFLAKSGYVAVWVTNKAAIRAQVLELCTNHGLILEEEWIWLKVTVEGEPVTPLDGLWRKPYEILLLFRRKSEQQGIVRRVGIAVPDIHSRKPNLKSMFEQLLPKKYNALEIFARSLTAGWWSWGDEVLKFQHESNWQ